MALPDFWLYKKMAALRQQTLPEWSRIEGFGGYYQLTTNTFIPDSELGKMIRVGDQVEILAQVPLAQGA